MHVKDDQFFYLLIIEISQQMLGGIYMKNDRKKRLSETKPVPVFDLKLITSTKKYSSNHNRSSSMNKDKKQLRLHTDYVDYEQVHTTNVENYQKGIKRINLAGKRDTCEFQVGDNLIKNFQVQSTKNNVKKNLDLRALFKNNKDYQSKIREKKIKSNNHPLLKFITKKNKQRFESPYEKNIRMDFSGQSHNRSVSKSKNSVSKTKGNLNVKKQEIKLKPTHHIDLKRREEEQSTVKTIKKATEAEKNKTAYNPHDEEFSENQSEGYGLTEEEEETFGDRFPYGFQKVKLLGRGGFSLVWLGKHIKSGKLFAIKQIITQNTHQTHIKEIWFGTMFFTLGGVAKPQFSIYPGIKNLVKLYSYEINQTDTWIFYQKCGNSLGSNLYDIRSEKVYGDQKLYKIHYKPVYQAMSKNPSILTTLVIEICKALALLSEYEVVHSDLKTENILIKYDENKNYEISEVKLIDYGSSFQFKNISQFSMATPQYMPPEILNYIIHQNEGEYEEDLYEQVMTNYKNPWTVDMWSLGCVLLQIVVGVPLWMSLPLLVPNKSGNSFLQKEGLFAVKGRLFPEIIAKQRKINLKLDEILQRQNYSRIVPSTNMKLVIKSMLEIDFNKRISPNEVIKLLSPQLNHHASTHN